MPVKKKVDFYSGARVLTNHVMNNYLKGEYFNKSTHAKELIPKKINKYNLEMIGRINELNVEWYRLIQFNKVTKSLIELSDDFQWGDASNLYRLLHSQSGTIKFNRILKKALKTYVINKQEVLNEIRIDLDKQLDRVNRNKTLMIDILKEYQLDKLIQAIEKNNNITFYDHLIEFLKEHDNNDEKIKYKKEHPDDEDLRGYYDLNCDKYIQHLKDVANSHNIDLNNSISETLKLHREIRSNLIKEINESKRITKQIHNEAKFRELLHSENSILQSDLNSCDLGNLKKYTPSTIYKLVKQILDVSTRVYYVAGITEKAIKYPHIENGKVTQSIFKTRMFDNKAEAEEYKLYVKQNNKNFEKSYLEVLSLEVPTAVQNNSSYATPDIVHNMQILLSSEEPSFNEKLIIKHIFTKAIGLDTNSSCAEAVIYCLNGVVAKNKISPHSNIIYKEGDHYTTLLRNKRGDEKLHKELLVHSLEEASNFNIKDINRFEPKLSDYDNYIIRSFKISIQSQWYAKNLYKTNELSRYISEMLNKIAIDYHSYSYKFNYFQDTLTTDNMRKLRKNTIEKFNITSNIRLYYIIEIRDVNIHFYKGVGKELTSKSIMNVKLFTNYNSALKEIENIYDKNKPYIYRIMPMDIIM